MHLIVVNENGENSEPIGGLSMQLSSICVQSVVSEWYELKSKGQIAGHVHIKSQWKPPREPLKEMSKDFMPIEWPQLKFTNGAIDEQLASFSLPPSYQ